MASDVSQDVMHLLEEVAGEGQPLLIELRDGRRFADGVCDVLRQCGEDYVILHAHNRMIVRDIVHAERLHGRGDEDSEWTG